MVIIAQPHIQLKQRFRLSEPMLPQFVDDQRGQGNGPPAARLRRLFSHAVPGLFGTRDDGELAALQVDWNASATLRFRLAASRTARRAGSGRTGSCSAPPQ